MKKIFLCTLLIIVCSYQPVLSQTRIINGDKVSAGDVKWKSIIALGEDPNVSSDSQFCGGTLIDTEWVLTAAHCVREGDVTRSANEVFIYSNTYRLETGLGQAVSVEKIIPHPSYDEETNDNDIALVKLSESIVGVEPISIRNEDPVPHLIAWVAGWGNMSREDPPSYPADLMEADVPIIDFDSCNHSYENSSNPDYLSRSLTGNMFCAGYMKSTKDSCQGDSGGPLIIQNGDSYELVGVVSWGFGCAIDDFPGVYTKINNYNTWISNTKNNIRSVSIVPLIKPLLLSEK